jgi:hypothetical protein
MKTKQLGKAVALVALARKLGVGRTLRLGTLAFETYLAVQALRRRSRRSRQRAS